MISADKWSLRGVPVDYKLVQLNRTMNQLACMPWSLQTGGIHMQMVFTTAGFTVLDA